MRYSVATLLLVTPGVNAQCDDSGIRGYCNYGESKEPQACFNGDMDNSRPGPPEPAPPDGSNCPGDNSALACENGKGLYYPQCDKGESRKVRDWRMYRPVSVEDSMREEIWYNDLQCDGERATDFYGEGIDNAYECRQRCQEHINNFFPGRDACCQLSFEDKSCYLRYDFRVEGEKPGRAMAMMCFNGWCPEGGKVEERKSEDRKDRDREDRKDRDREDRKDRDDRKYEEGKRGRKGRDSDCDSGESTDECEDRIRTRRGREGRDSDCDSDEDSDECDMRRRDGRRDRKKGGDDDFDGAFLYEEMTTPDGTTHMRMIMKDALKLSATLATAVSTALMLN